MYGLGSLVKSIGKAAKKIVKSPIGKAAALYFAPMAFGQGAGLAGYKGLFGTGSFNPFLKKVAGDQVLSPFGMLGKKLGITTLEGGLTKFGKTAALTIPSVLAAAGVEDEQEIAELKQDKSALTAALERGYRNLNPGVSDEEVASFVRTYSAEGGRIGFNEGSYNPGARYQFLIDKFNSGEKLTDDEVRELEALEMSYADESKEMASGGRVKFAMGDSAEQNAIQASGIMGLPLNENPAGITELDLRETGGFIPPVGVKEKADDIPAMLSNNEFVFTADAVRGMGGGDVDKGAERMYAMMKTLENGGRV
jgi:hypothetical protein